MQIQKRWWLGLLSFAGIYNLLDIIAAFDIDKGDWEHLYLPRLIWLVHFVPIQ